MFRTSPTTCAAVAMIAVELTFANPLAAQQASGFASWTDEQKEEFLLTAEVVDTKRISVGVTRPLRATLEKDGVVHDAHIQRINERAPVMQFRTGTQLSFRDYWGFNIAAYKLDRLLGLNIVPVSVERKYQGKRGSFTWWIDNVQMMDKDRVQNAIEPPDRDDFNTQMATLQIFNALIYNTDPNLGNILIDDSWKVWMIDFTRAFRIQTHLLGPERLRHIDRDLFERLRSLDAASVQDALGDSLAKGETKGLLMRRDELVRLFDEKIAAQGADAVLYGGRQKPVSRMQ